jgi:hypothetical protein
MFSTECALDRDTLQQRCHTSRRSPWKTLGLPIIRTSVDHGTAFDQAGKWTASEFSLENAIDYAIRLAASSASGILGNNFV